MEKRTSGNKVYIRNKNSEKIRNENDMLRLRQKLANERLKPRIVRQFQTLIKDNRNMMTNHYLVNKILPLSKNRSAAGHSNADSHLTTISNDNAVSPLNNINFNVSPGKIENNTMENDSPMKHEQLDMGEEDKIVEEEEHINDNVGIVENESFAGTEHETSASKIMHDDDLDSSAEERPATTIIATPRNLSALEAFGVACTLERWVDRIDLLDVLDGTTTLGSGRYDADGTAADRELPIYSQTRSESIEATRKTEKLRTFVMKTFEQTVGELRLSGTFAALQRANDSMLKTVRDERELEAELLSNRDELNVLRNKKKKHKQRHNEEKWRVEMKRKGLTEKLEKTLKLIEIENKYLLTWEDLWLNENKELLKEEEKINLKQIRVIDADSSIEDSCMREAKHIFSEYIAAMDNHVRTWEELYTMYVGAIDINILTLEQEQEYLDDSHERLQDYVDDLQTTIDEFEERKRERDDRQRVIMHRNYMAIRIQAFWRGTMVRRFLGPYKKLKKILKNKRTMAKKKNKSLKK